MKKTITAILTYLEIKELMREMTPDKKLKRIREKGAIMFCMVENELGNFIMKNKEEVIENE